MVVTNSCFYLTSIKSALFYGEPLAASKKVLLCDLILHSFLCILVYSLQYYLMASSRLHWNYVCEKDPMYTLLYYVTFFTNAFVVVFGYSSISSYILTRHLVGERRHLWKSMSLAVLIPVIYAVSMLNYPGLINIYLSLDDNWYAVHYIVSIT